MNKRSYSAKQQHEFTFELVVTQGDVTPYGSASFINYIRWYNIARDALLQWRNLGFPDTLKTTVETEVTFCNIQYKREAMLQDEILIKVNASAFTDKRFTLLFTVIRRDNALLISLGKQVIQFRNSKTDTIFTLPDTLLKGVLRPIEVNESTLLFNY